VYTFSVSIPAKRILATFISSLAPKSTLLRNNRLISVGFDLLNAYKKEINVFFNKLASILL